MFLFLQNWRTTLIPAITIPVSLIGTFAFVKLFGFSINTLTLFGITLATGLVVDDAIVVIENIERHIHEFRKGARQAASDAMGEVTGAVIATALVLAAVFVPVAFFPGTTGRLYQQFALTIAVSMAISAFNALTLTPALSALLLGHVEKPKGAFFRGVNRVIDGGTALLVAAAARARSRRRGSSSLVFVLLLGATYWVYTRVPTGFVPDEDQGYVFVIVQAPQGASLDYTMNIVRQVGGRHAQGCRRSAVCSPPAASASSAAAPNQGIFFVSLKAFAERQGARAVGAGDRRAAVRRLQPDPRRAGAPVPAAGHQRAEPVRRVLVPAARSERRARSRTWPSAAQQIVAQGNQTPGLTGLFTQFTANDPQLLVNIDREQAKSLGVSLGDITGTMQVLLGSSYVNDFDFNNRSYRVYVQADQQFRATPQDIERYYVRAADGQMMPLSNLVDGGARRPRRRPSPTTTCSDRSRSSGRPRRATARARRCRRWRSCRTARCRRA